ncbi:FliM/FliN family flagellar motor C-terminal domain-containing protein [Variovorax sp. 160MFSha2.1]|uniref:FliM/FliN family flagellar motor C-terminal domain-containing protein n=1 Tax=Variovorax sp. 160MFSha2.1 TaxID=3158367 RepID=UPI003AAAE34E
MNVESSSPLLDATESALRARPLRSWSSKQKDVVRDRFAALHRDWSAEWMPVREAVSTASDVEVIEPDGTVVFPSDDSACWAFAASSRRAAGTALSSESLDSSFAALQAIASRMFFFDLASAVTAPASPVIAPAIVRAAWADWLQRVGTLLAGFGLTPQRYKDTPGARMASSPWSGALLVRWTWCGGVWSLGLPFEAIAALLGPEQAATRTPSPVSASQEPKERLDRALAGQQISLRVLLEGAELNLGQLQELRLDDVVPLEHLLDSPALVVGSDGTPVCSGWLGQSEGRIAVELAAMAGLPAPAAGAAGAAPNANTLKGRKS